MPATRLIRHLTAALLVPLVMVVGLSTAHAFYRCGMDRVARTVCCCPQAHQRDAAPASTTATAQLKAACCCSIELTAAPHAPTAQVHDRDSMGATQARVLLFAVTLPVAPEAPALSRVPHREQPVDPPRTTASLFGQRIAFLV